ncbi:MAG: tryptophan-rich sensory protein [Bacteroidetes bacterium]|nr:MAG: tryptophan-rich sensory protein [Bacteroidota bacterium]
MPRFLALLNLLALGLTIYANAAVTTLAARFGLPARSIGELSASYPNYFVPSGVTFAIWGLIYLWLGAFVVYQGRALLGHPIPDSGHIGGLFFLSCVFNVAWLFVWVAGRPGLSLLVMLGLLATLLAIYLRLGVGVSPIAPADRWLVHAPFSLYLGWISVATIANVTTWLVDRGWGGGPIAEPLWAALMVVVAGLLALFMFWNRQDVVYVGVILWALLGVVFKRQAAGSPADALVVLAVYLTFALVLGVLGLRTWLAGQGA